MHVGIRDYTYVFTLMRFGGRSDTSSHSYDTIHSTRHDDDTEANRFDLLTSCQSNNFARFRFEYRLHERDEVQDSLN